MSSCNSEKSISSISIAHSIKSLEIIHSSIKYWHNPDDVKDLIDFQIQQLRKILNEPLKETLNDNQQDSSLS